MKKLMLAGMMAVGMTGAWAAGEPSIDLTRVQQRYPWNGLVDIDYTVANVPNPEDYYLKFTFFPTPESAGIVATNFLDCSMLMMASNGTYRATWDTREQGAVIVSKNVTISADLICDPGCKGERTHYANFIYLVIDLSGGPTATSYPVTTERFLTQDEANAKYNTEVYKTSKLVLRRVKAGTFMMGSPDSEQFFAQYSGWAGPDTQHQVTLSKDYFLSIYQVTQKQWQLVMSSNPSRDFIGNERPVNNVSYQTIRGSVLGRALPIDGQVDDGSFIKVLRDRTKLDGLDLPTEAQWEYACRAGTTTETYFGDGVASDAALFGKYAWFNGNSSSTQGVGQKLPNQWGFYDMLGNVWEICLDRTAGGRASDLGLSSVTDPLSQAGSGKIICRGASAADPAALMRSATRDAADATDTATQWYGFRVAMPNP